MSNSVAPAVKTANDEIPWNPKVRQKKQPADYVVDFLIGLLVVAVVIVVLYPLWFIVIASFSNASLVSQGGVTLFPKGIDFAGYAKILDDARIWTGYKNTIIYSVVGTIVNMLVTLPVAFALSRREFKARRVILFLFTFTMFFAGGLIPSYLLFKDLGILNSMWVFILPGAVNVYNVIIARSFFETSIPEELHDAAQVDGLGYFRYFMKIVLPLSSAIIAVIALYYFVGHWNDFFTGLIYTQSGEAAVAERVAEHPAGQPDDHIRWRFRRSFDAGTSAGCGSDQVWHHHRVHPASAGCVSVPAEVLQQGRDDRRSQGLIASSRVRSADTKQCGPASQSIGLHFLPPFARLPSSCGSLFHIPIAMLC